MESSQILKGIKENAFHVFKDKKLTHGMKYKIQPPINFTNLDAIGCPNQKIGWMTPNDQATFKLLRNYFAEQLGIAKSDDFVSLTLFNTKFDHEKQGCYEICLKYTNDPDLCLRTWLITNLHVKNDKKTHKIKSDPWFRIKPSTMDLTNVSGCIRSIFIPDSSQNKIKLWANIDEGLASAKHNLPVTDNFSAHDLLELSDSE